MVNVRTFTADPVSAAQWQPYGATDLPNYGGIMAGPILRSRKIFWWHPWWYQKDRLTEAKEYLLLGPKDAGKSTWLKLMALRFAGMRMGPNALDEEGAPDRLHIRMHDRKPEAGAGENQAIMDALGGVSVYLNRQKSINLLDRSMGMEEPDMMDILGMALQHAKERPYKDNEVLAIQIAVSRLLKANPALPQLETVETYLRNPREEDLNNYFKEVDSKVIADYMHLFADRPKVLAELKETFSGHHKFDFNALAEDSVSMAGAAQRILGADYGNVFGGITPLSELLGLEISNWVMPPSMTHNARSLIAIMEGRWNALATEKNLYHLIPHVNLEDEVADIVKSLNEIRLWAESNAKARGTHQMKGSALQYLHQLIGAGNADSEIRTHAENIKRGIAGYWLGRIKADDTEAQQEYSKLGVSDQDIDLITSFPVGCFGFKLPNHPLVPIQIKLSKLNAQLVYTNSANDRVVQ